MDAAPFDAVIRSLTTGDSRRDFLRGLAGAALGLAMLGLPVHAKATKKKSKTPARNEFGCLNVGQRCNGRDSNCCSGICGANGICARTTGNAGFCLDLAVEELSCAACKKDADCTVGFGPGAACIVCDVTGAETGGTVCAPPAA